MEVACQRGATASMECVETRNSRSVEGCCSRLVTMIILPLIFLTCGLLVAAAFYVVNSEE